MGRFDRGRSTDVVVCSTGWVLFILCFFTSPICYEELLYRNERLLLQEAVSDCRQMRSDDYWESSYSLCTVLTAAQW